MTDDLMQEPLPGVLCLDFDPRLYVCTKAAGHDGDHGCWAPAGTEEGRVRVTWPQD